MFYGAILHGRAVKNIIYGKISVCYAINCHFKNANVCVCFGMFANNSVFACARRIIWNNFVFARILSNIYQIKCSSACKHLFVGLVRVLVCKIDFHQIVDCWSSFILFH